MSSQCEHGPHPHLCSADFSSSGDYVNVKLRYGEFVRYECLEPWHCTVDYIRGILIGWVTRKSEVPCDALNRTKKLIGLDLLADPLIGRGLTGKELPVPVINKALDELRFANQEFEAQSQMLRDDPDRAAEAARMLFCARRCADAYGELCTELYGDGEL